MCAAYSSRPPGPTATGPRCAARSPSATRGSPPELPAYSWKAQSPACDLPQAGRRNGANKAAVAVARELSGFVWGAMTERTGAC